MYTHNLVCPRRRHVYTTRSGLVPRLDYVCNCLVPSRTREKYRNLPSKRPWALEIYGQKTGRVRAYMERPFVRIAHIHTDHRIIKNGWALIRLWALTRENTVHATRWAASRVRLGTRARLYVRTYG